MIFSKFTRGKEITRWFILELVSTFFNQCLSGKHYRKEIKSLKKQWSVSLQTGKTYDHWR